MAGDPRAPFFRQRAERPGTSPLRHLLQLEGCLQRTARRRAPCGGCRVPRVPRRKRKGSLCTCPDARPTRTNPSTSQRATSDESSSRSFHGALARRSSPTIALWTDGRYFLQGRGVDAKRTFMRDRVPGAVPSQDWLADELPSGATVGFNSYLLSNKMVGEMRAALSPKNISLRGLDADLIDEVRCRTALLTSPRVQQRFARKHSPRTAAHQRSAHQHPCSLDLQCVRMTQVWSAERPPQPLAVAFARTIRTIRREDRR
jgi:hypothetical protein